MMHDAPGILPNPPRNSLGAGVTIDKVQASIEKSGYPLQTHVAHVLRPLGFNVSPEWSFIDRDTNELRSMDLRATSLLYEFDGELRARPSLDLLIECKQGELPYIFFTGEKMPWNASVPYIVGLLRESFTIYTDDSEATWSMDVQQALNLRAHPFYSMPPVAYTLSKCQRKSSDLILSGEETYNNIIMPLTKAMRHLRTSEAPPQTAIYVDVHYALAVAVIDAPMIEYVNNSPKLVPWVRVLRHEAGLPELGKNDRGAIMSIDVVHRDFLYTYLTEHVFPAANSFAEKVLKHHIAIAECEGFVEKMGEHRPMVFEPRIRPRM